MEGPNHLSRHLQMLIQPPSLFDGFNKVDLGQPGIISGLYWRG